MGVKLRKKEVAERYKHTVRTIERWWRDPAIGFPQPIYIGKAPLWDLCELETWERTRPHRPPVRLTLDDLDLVPLEAAE
jgi:hypothetical protein